MRTRTRNHLRRFLVRMAIGAFLLFWLWVLASIGYETAQLIWRRF